MKTERMPEKGRTGKDSAGNPPVTESRKDRDETIPVCMGEFGLEEAREFRRLWEATWSQDSRHTKKK